MNVFLYITKSSVSEYYRITSKHQYELFLKLADWMDAYDHEVFLFKVANKHM